MENPVYFPALVSAWTAVFARVILQSSKLRLWGKHAAKQIQYHTQFGKIFELFLLILEQKINRN